MTELTPPIAARKPHKHKAHGLEWDDDYAWLRDPKYPAVEDAEVLDYLKAENAYFDGWKARQQGLLDTLFAEMKGRIKEDDRSVPIKDGDWLYWWAFEPGAQYRTWYRRLIAGGPDEVIFDEPTEAEGKEYFVLGAMEVSPDHQLLATLVDDSGSERFSLRIRDLATGKDIETVTDVGIGEPTWSNDSKGVVFTEVNDKWRSYRARYHRLGADPAQAVTLYEETEDLGFSVGVGKSQDESLIFIATGDNTTSEVRFVAADDPSQPLTLISPRQPNREYDVDAAHGKLWILTNDEHINFRLAEAELDRPGRMDHGDRGIGRDLSDRHHALSRLSGGDPAGRRARPAGAAHLRRRGNTAAVRGGELHAPISAAIPNSRPPRSGSAIRRWSRRRRCSIITRTARELESAQGPGNPVGL